MVFHNFFLIYTVISFFEYVFRLIPCALISSQVTYFEGINERSSIKIYSQEAKETAWFWNRVVCNCTVSKISNGELLLYLSPFLRNNHQMNANFQTASMRIDKRWASIFNERWLKHRLKFQFIEIVCIKSPYARRFLRSSLLHRSFNETFLSMLINFVNYSWSMTIFLELRLKCFLHCN